MTYAWIKCVSLLLSTVSWPILITEMYYIFWYILLTMIVHGCRSSLSICNTVVLLNLLYKKIILVSCLLHWSWVNFVSHISLTLSRALLPPHSWAVDVLSIPVFKWCWAAWPTVHTLHFCMSIPSILFSQNCIQCVCAGTGISGSVEHSLCYHNGYCLLKWFHSYFPCYVTYMKIIWCTIHSYHIVQTGN